MTPRPSLVRLFTLAALVTVAIGAKVADASSILAPKSGGWEYTFCDPTSDPSWDIAVGSPHPNAARECQWQIGAAPFGSMTDYDPDFDYETYWRPVDEAPDAEGNFRDDLWVRRTFDVSGFDLNTILWQLGVDNGFKLYLNGSLVDEDNAEHFTHRWEYEGLFNPFGFIGPVNYLALALEDHGGFTAFDMQITGEQAAPVPEPETIALLGLGTLAVLATRKRLF